MADVNIPKEILDKMINLGGTHKVLCCKSNSCKGSFQDHISVSYAEVFSKDGNGRNLKGTAKPLGQIFGRFVDLIPFVEPLLMGNPFVCTKCGRIIAEGGLFSDLQKPYD